MRSLLWALLLSALAARVASAQECITCFNERCDELSPYLPSCASSGSVLFEGVDGLEVYLDGEWVGRTPLGEIPLEAGRHSLRAESACVRVPEREFIVREGERSVQRLLAATRMAELDLFTSDGSTGSVHIDGVPFGRLPNRFLVPLCSSELEVLLDGGARQTRRLELEESALNTVEIAGEPEPAPLPVASAPLPKWLSADAFELLVLLPLDPRSRSREDELRRRLESSVGPGLVVVSREALDTLLESEGVSLSAGCDAACRLTIERALGPRWMLSVSGSGVLLEGREGETASGGDSELEALVKSQGLGSKAPGAGRFVENGWLEEVSFETATRFCASLSDTAPHRLPSAEELSRLSRESPASGHHSFWASDDSPYDRCEARYASFSGVTAKADLGVWNTAAKSWAGRLVKCVRASPSDPQPRKTPGEGACAASHAPDLGLFVGAGGLQGLWGVGAEYRFTRLARELEVPWLGMFGIGLGTGDRALSFGLLAGPRDNRGGWFASVHGGWNAPGFLAREGANSPEPEGGWGLGVGASAGWDFRPMPYLSLRLGAGAEWNPNSANPLGPVLLELKLGSVFATREL